MFFGILSAQNLKNSEEKLIDTYQKLSDLKEENQSGDLFYKKSQEFSGLFKKIIRNNPASLSYSFQYLVDKKVAFVSTSEDGNVRVYNWDTQTGGTMKNFDQIIQFRSAGKVYTIFSEKIPDSAEFCSKIYSMKIKGKVYYFPVF